MLNQLRQQVFTLTSPLHHESQGCHQDGELVHETKTLAQWKPTNPKGYINKFEHYAAIRPRFLLLERSFADATYDRVQPLPEPLNDQAIFETYRSTVKKTYKVTMGLAGSNRAELCAYLSHHYDTYRVGIRKVCLLTEIYADEFDFITSVIREMPTFIGIKVRSGQRHYVVRNETTAGKILRTSGTLIHGVHQRFMHGMLMYCPQLSHYFKSKASINLLKVCQTKFGGKKDNVRETLSSSLRQSVKPDQQGC